MSILDELVKNKKTINLREVEDFAQATGEALAEANRALEELQRKHQAIKEENLTFNTVQTLVSKMDSFEAKFAVLVNYLKLSTAVLAKESELLDKIDEALKV